MNTFDANNKTHDGADERWIHDYDAHEEVVVNLTTESTYGYNNEELFPIQEFVTDTNEKRIKNKIEAADAFRKLKNKVKNERLVQDYMKELERSLFDDDLSSTKNCRQHQIKKKSRIRSQNINTKINVITFTHSTCRNTSRKQFKIIKKRSNLVNIQLV